MLHHVYSIAHIHQYVFTCIAQQLMNNAQYVFATNNWAVER